MVNLYLYLEKLPVFPQQLPCFTFPPAVYEGSVSPHPHQHWLLSGLLLFSHGPWRGASRGRTRAGSWGLGLGLWLWGKPRSSLPILHHGWVMARDPGVNFLPLGWEAPAPAEATIRPDSTPAQGGWAPVEAAISGSFCSEEEQWWAERLKLLSETTREVQCAEDPGHPWLGRRGKRLLPESAGPSGRVRAACWPPAALPAPCEGEAEGEGGPKELVWPDCGCWIPWDWAKQTWDMREERKCDQWGHDFPWRWCSLVGGVQQLEAGPEDAWGGAHVWECIRGGVGSARNEDAGGRPAEKVVGLRVCPRVPTPLPWDLGLSVYLLPQVLTCKLL